MGGSGAVLIGRLGVAHLISVCSVAKRIFGSHPCKERKDGATSFLVVRTKTVLPS